MEPICQFCGAENPMWQLTERSSGIPGPEVCQSCVQLLRIQLKTPTILRGRGLSSGSAHLLVMTALARPGRDVYVVAETPDDLAAAIDEVQTLIAPGQVQSIRNEPFMLVLNNNSRILGRLPQRDGKGIKGINPHVVWLVWDGDPPRYVTTEIVEIMRPAMESDIVAPTARPTFTASEVEEWRAVATADTLHMLPIEAAVASQKYLAERLVELADSGAIEVTE